MWRVSSEASDLVSQTRPVRSIQEVPLQQRQRRICAQHERRHSCHVCDVPTKTDHRPWESDIRDVSHARHLSRRIQISGESYYVICRT